MSRQILHNRLPHCAQTGGFNSLNMVSPEPQHSTVRSTRPKLSRRCANSLCSIHSDTERDPERNPLSADSSWRPSHRCRPHGVSALEQMACVEHYMLGAAVGVLSSRSLPSVSIGVRLAYVLHLRGRYKDRTWFFLPCDAPSAVVPGAETLRSAQHDARGCHRVSHIPPARLPGWIQSNVIFVKCVADVLDNGTTSVDKCFAVAFKTGCTIRRSLKQIVS
jgi:hypothetical protein